MQAQWSINQRTLSNKDKLVMLQLQTDQSKHQQDNERLFRQKFKSHPPQNVIYIKIDPKLNELKNIDKILLELQKIFNSSNDVYIFYSGVCSQKGDLCIKQQTITYDMVVQKWQKRRCLGKNNLFIFIDSRHSGCWCYRIMKQKHQNIVVFSSCDRQQTGHQFKGFFTYTILALNNEFQSNSQLLTLYQSPKIGNRQTVADLTYQNMKALNRNIANAYSLGFPEKIFIDKHYEAFNEMPTQQQLIRSEVVKNQLKNEVINVVSQADKKRKSEIIPLLALAQVLQNQTESKGTAKVIFHQQKNQKTRKTLQALSNFLYYSSTPILDQKIKTEDYKYQYQEILEDKYKLQQFESYFRSKTAKKYKVPVESIRILEITKGSINVKYTIDVEYQPSGDFSVHKYFNYFHLSADLFCTQGNKVYPDKSSDGQYGKIDTRGGWPYFLPVKCSRYGLNVRGNYDNGHDTWLSMNNQPGQWAIAFHGVRQPERISQNSHQKCLNSLMSGLGKDKTIFKIQYNYRQSYGFQKAVNNQQIIGQGVYCTPHISTAIKQYTDTGVKINNQVYYLVFMCRVHPGKIKVCNRNDYWVINDPNYIRPYGIILVKEQDKKQYPTPQQLFGNRVFTWQTYKDSINKNRYIFKSS